MVGEFMQQALRAKVINGNDRFVDEFDTPPPADTSLGSMREWIRGLFRGDTQAPPPSPPATWPGGGLPPVIHDAPAPQGRPVPTEERVGG
jgi:penicillin-binding protein 1A